METSGPGPSHRKNSITITRTLDVASTHTSPASAGKVPGQQTVRIVATDGEPARSPRHIQDADASEKELADPATNFAPNHPGQGVRHSQEINAGINNPASSRDGDSNLVPSKLHQFQQSRRWAKQYGSHQEQLSSPMATTQSKLEQPSSIKPTNSPNAHRAGQQTELPRAMSRLSDSESLVHHQGLCRPLSMPTLYALSRKSKDKDRPQSLPMKWVRKIAHSRSRSRLKARLAEKQRNPSDASLTPTKQPRRRIRPQRAIADLRKRAGYRRQASGKTDNGTVVDLDSVHDRPASRKHTASPVPSLHDPEKAKRFSQECEAILSNIDFDRDWLASADVPSTVFSSSVQAIQPSGDVFDTDKSTVTRDHNVLQDKSSIATSSTARPRTGGESLPQSVAPQPPERTSSKGIKVAMAVEVARPRCLPGLSDFRDGAMLVGNDDADATSTAFAQPSPKLTAPTRMASIASTVSPSARGPKAAKSTDTLAMIEAHLHEGANTSLVARLKQKTAFMVSPHKRGISSGMPPERPLPDLPAVATRPSPGTSNATQPNEQQPKGHRKQQPSLAEQLVETLLDRQGLPRHSSSQRLEETAVAKGLAIDTGLTALPDSPALPTPSSLYSQPSLKSQVSANQKVFIRHDISRFRSDRVNDVRKRVKADVDRERRISEEDVTKPDVQRKPLEHPTPPLPPLPTAALNPQPSIDQLDKFPPVPTSRLASRTSGRSRSRSHARQNSRSSTGYQRPRVKQALGKSNIKVLVDSDPVSNNFRCGTASPTPSTTLSSRAPSPAKEMIAEKLNRPLDIRNTEIKPANSVKSSTRSLKSNSSAARTPRIFAFDNTSLSQIDSEDDTRSLISTAASYKTNKRKIRRRWNSKDIADVHMLSQDLESCYNTIMKQEKELRKQREEIQFISRVYAPLIRQHALKQAYRGAVESMLNNTPTKSSDTRKQPTTLAHRATVSDTATMRPISGISSTSTDATAASLTHGSTGSSSADPDACLNDAFEGVNIPSSRNQSRPGSRGTLLGNATASSSATALHRPPTVAQVVPKAKLMEELSLAESGVSEVIDGQEGKGKRLSINHALVETDYLEGALESVFAGLG